MKKVHGRRAARVSDLRMLKPIFLFIVLVWIFAQSKRGPVKFRSYLWEIRLGLRFGRINFDVLASLAAQCFRTFHLAQEFSYINNVSKSLSLALVRSWVHRQNSSAVWESFHHPLTTSLAKRGRLGGAITISVKRLQWTSFPTQGRSQTVQYAMLLSVRISNRHWNWWKREFRKSLEMVTLE